MTGTGIATSPSGKTEKVAYDIDVYQEEIKIPTRSGTGTIPGQERWEGTVRPACFIRVNGVVLTMDNGEEVPIFVIDESGRIAHG